MRTSGLILDVYDDFKGEVLLSIFPEEKSLPDFIKSAQSLSSEDLQRLPDDVFALVLQNGDESIRKFACVDEGNTTMSVLYFSKVAHKLPQEAQKVAAENLIKACGWYDLEVPDFLQKMADVTGTTSMPLQTSPLSIQPAKTQVSIKKAETMPHEVEGHKGEESDYGPEENGKYEDPKETKVKKAFLSPHVNVFGKIASVTETKTNTRFCLPSEGKYPIDDYVQIKTASNYFAEYHSQMSPAARHEYAMNLSKRASEVGLIVSDVARRYGNTTYADHDDMKIAFELREKDCAWDGDAVARFHELFEKRAELDPEVFATVLEGLDKTAGLDTHYGQSIPDAYMSTFGGFSKLAEEFSESIGDDFVSGEQLFNLAKQEKEKLASVFTQDFVDEFRQDPVGIYKSMPQDQRHIIMKMANQAA